MTIKDVIKISATPLGEKRVLDYLDGRSEGDGETLTKVDNLTRCANLVISELAFTYVKMYKTERVSAVGGKVEFSALSEKILEVVKVEDAQANSLYYQIKPTYIKLNAQTVDITYAYTPSNYGLTDQTGYTGKEITARTLALGVNAEYLLIEREFDQSVMWRDRYVKAVYDGIKPKNGKIKQRKWA